MLWFVCSSKVTMRSDNAPDMVQVLGRALAALCSSGVESAFAEGSVLYDTQTSGAAECAGKQVQGIVRARLFGLERKLRARVPLDYPAIT